MEIYLYQTDSGNCPVQNFFNDLEVKAKLKIEEKIERLEILGTQMVHEGNFLEKLSGCSNLYELKIRVSKLFYRIILVIIDSTAYLLSAFCKKTNQTPKQEIELTKNRAENLKKQIPLGIYK